MRKWLVLACLLGCNEDPPDKGTDPEPAADADEDGFVDDEDCEPDNAEVFPGADEICNGIDDDCDGTIDGPDASGAVELYVDADGDGFGDPTTAVTRCPAEGFVEDATDCDDAAVATAPSAPDTCDQLDNNCDGIVDGGAPCVDGRCDISVDLAASVFSGRLRYDGAEVVDASAEAEFALILTDVDGGVPHRVELDGGPNWSMGVAPGVYNVDFELLPAAAVFRRADGIVRVADAVDLTQDASLDVEVALVQLSGLVLYDDEPIEASDPRGPEWALRLTNGSGDVVVHELEGSDVYDVVVYEGIYDVDFSLIDSGAVTTPVLTTKRIASELVVQGDTSLDVTIETSAATGSVVFDDDQVRATFSAPDWELRFTDVDSGFQFFAAFVGAPSFSLDLHAGVYDVDFRLLNAAAVDRFTPGWTRVHTGVDLRTPDGMPIDVGVGELSGVISYDGAAIEQQSFWIPDWQLLFVNKETGDEHIEERFGSTTYLAFLPEGTYDVFFELVLVTAVESPVEGRYPVATDLVIDGASTLDIELPVHELSGTISYDGGDLNEDVNLPAIWRIHATDGDRTYTQQFNGGDSYVMRLFPGEYDLVFELADPSKLPTGAQGRVEFARDVVLNADTTLDVALTTLEVSGDVMIAGMLPPDNLPDDPEWTLSWTDVDSMLSGQIDLDGGTGWSTRLYPGTYDLGVQWASPGVAGVVSFGSCVTLE